MKMIFVDRPKNWCKLCLVCLALVSVFVLAACGGSSTSDSSSSSPEGGGGTGTGTSTGGTNGTDSFTIGSFSGTTFQAGVIDVGIGGSSLSAGGVTSLRVSIVDQNNNAISEDVEVTFSSPCLVAGLASIETPVTTENGSATSNYDAQGCTGDDVVTASAVVGNAQVEATATINVESDTVQTISLESVQHEFIQLEGTGDPSTSRVTFQVLGSTGAPVANVGVDFSLSTTIGGLNLTEASGTTDSDGRVDTVVQAGDVATTVRVTAVVTGSSPEIATQSGRLIVSTGSPDQNSISISAEDLSPDSWGTDGVVVPITVRLADAFNNPPPEGTAVNFTTEGGSIESGCLTDDSGACSVEWVSQDPRPSDGRVTILATAIGNESFVDGNGNRRFDSSSEDVFIESGCNAANRPYIPGNPIQFCDDLPEAYLDKNENNQRESDEEFVDFNSNLTYDGADMLYNGRLCENPGGGDCDTSNVTIRDDLVMAMSSGQGINLDILENSGTANDGTVSVSGTASASIQLEVADQFFNSIPTGYEVTWRNQAQGTSGCYVVQGPDIYKISGESPNADLIDYQVLNGDCMSGDTSYIVFEVRDTSSPPDTVANIILTVNHQ